MVEVHSCIHEKGNNLNNSSKISHEVKKSWVGPLYFQHWIWQLDFEYAKRVVIRLSSALRMSNFLECEWDILFQATRYYPIIRLNYLLLQRKCFFDYVVLIREHSIRSTYLLVEGIVVFSELWDWIQKFEEESIVVEEIIEFAWVERIIRIKLTVNSTRHDGDFNVLLGSISPVSAYFCRLWKLHTVIWELDFLTFEINLRAIFICQRDFSLGFFPRILCHQIVAWCDDFKSTVILSTVVLKHEQLLLFLEVDVWLFICNHVGWSDYWWLFWEKGGKVDYKQGHDGSY